MSRITRLAVAAALAAAAFGAAPAQAEAPECTEANPCYQCVMYPCYPSDWPPFLLDKVRDVVGGGGR